MSQVIPTNPVNLHIETRGKGPDLVMLHGWGVNSTVFTPLYESLSQYRVHYVDLPGFGLSQSVEGDIGAWVDILVQSLPANAIWAGWSLGGLVATQAALSYPSYIKGLITIASSPCFMAREDEAWPGIPPQVLNQFREQLGQNLPKTIERFLAIQAMGSETAKEDIKQLRDLVLSRPLPDTKALSQGLSMLTKVDLRPQLSALQQPWLRVWGRLDGLVPKRVQPQMPTGDQIEDAMLAKASHAPFFSHRDDFLQVFLPWLAIHTR